MTPREQAEKDFLKFTTFYKRVYSIIGKKAIRQQLSERDKEFLRLYSQASQRKRMKA